MNPPPRTPETRSPRVDSILAAVLPVFARFGFRKTSMDDLAKAAGLSKQGLYLHFSSKDEIFLAAMHHYLEEGLSLVDRALQQAETPLVDRLVAAMDAWFGRHLATFSPESFDIIQAGDRLSAEATDSYKIAFRQRIATALIQSPECTAELHVSAEELARVLFTFGLSWKDGRPSRAEFIENVRLCVMACLPVRNSPRAKRSPASAGKVQRAPNKEAT
jgi:TetR/AcrR family transcriptional regulator, regulator of autoinduction and epiphytic fitness